MFVHDYYVEIEPLPQAEGGGFLATVPDLPGCMSDGDTFEELQRNIADAIDCWIAAAQRLGREVPKPAKVNERRA
jgi:predicted RNase H-like HicB family nuclease